MSNRNVYVSPAGVRFVLQSRKSGMVVIKHEQEGWTWVLPESDFERWKRVERNARFWTYVCGAGFVKITLKPGQALTHLNGGATEEGYSWNAETWEHCGDHVACRISSWGRDCGGRHGEERDYHCELDKLDAGGGRLDEATGKVVKVAAWEPGESSCYDEFAEQMGY